MYFFLTVNLILSLLAIFLCLIFYKKISTIQQLEVEYKELLKEAEDTISSFVYELKEENEKFLKSIEKKNLEENNSSSSTSKINIVEDPIDKADLHELLYSNIQIDVDEKEVNTMDTVEEKTPYELAIELHESGLSFEQIAKKLNLGKTEVELLLKFRQ
ncbi:MAG: hypothetical protein LPK00_03225 [Bacillaceae bacterium]|nr:hypothetical protein [Bacillaceae bacterium]